VLNFVFCFLNFLFFFIFYFQNDVSFVIPHVFRIMYAMQGKRSLWPPVLSDFGEI